MGQNRTLHDANNLLAERVWGGGSPAAWSLCTSLILHLNKRNGEGRVRETATVSTRRGRMRIAAVLLILVVGLFALSMLPLGPYLAYAEPDKPALTQPGNSLDLGYADLYNLDFVAAQPVASGKDLRGLMVLQADQTVIGAEPHGPRRIAAHRPNEVIAEPVRAGPIGPFIGSRPLRQTAAP